MQLRPYQEAALEATFDYWRDGGDHPLVVMATGTGKSLVQASLADRLTTQYSGMRFVSVTHVQELIEQNYKELLNLNPLANAGMYSAGLGQRDLSSPVIFGGIQSLYRQVDKLGWVDCLSVDEAHLIPRKADTMYGKFISRLLQINPDMRVFGLTATPYRIDSGRLDEGDERLFDRVVYSYDIGDGIRDGYLSRLVSKGTSATIDVGGVATRGGDYVAEALQAACDQEEITRAAVSEIVAAGANRRSWLVFCAGVQHAYHVRDEIRSYGITCETITGDTPADERRRIIEAFKRGEIRCLTNNTVLTTGFNAPAVDLIAGLRPTKSTGLYVQIAGRGTRLFPGKENCLYLDFARNCYLHGPVDDVSPRKPGKGSGEAPVKECPNCRTLVPISCRECPECDNAFEINDKPKHEATAGDDPILSIKMPEELPVVGRSFSRHHASSGRELIRVDYSTGWKTYTQWLYSAGNWGSYWKNHGGENPPDTINGFLTRQAELGPTKTITIRKSGKYWNVVGARPDREAFASGARGMEEAEEDIPF